MNKDTNSGGGGVVLVLGALGIGGIFYYLYREYQRKQQGPLAIPPAWGDLMSEYIPAPGKQPPVPVVPPKPALEPKPGSIPAMPRVGMRFRPTVPSATTPKPETPLTAEATSRTGPVVGSRGSAPAPANGGGKPVDLLAAVKAEAPAFGLDPKVVYAVLITESAGKTVDPKTGKVIIRFEPHVFAKLTARKKLNKSKVSKSEIEQHGAKVLNPGMAHINDGRSRKGGQDAEWETLARAQAIDSEAAIMATSWGLGQIMGFNYKAAGFKSAQEMLDMFASGVQGQVRGTLKFITSNPKMVRALQARDFPAFVAIYNGAPAGSTHNTGYVNRMQAALAKLG